MRSPWAFLLSAICASAAAASPAQVLLYDPGVTPSADSQTIDPSTARLVFAHRLGLSQFHDLKDAKEKLIEQLNTFGGNRQQLFGQTQKSAREHGFIIVEGLNELNDFIPSSARSYSALSIDNPPSSASSLLEEFIEHADYISKQPNSPWLHTYNAEQIAELFGSFLDTEAEDSGSSRTTRGPVSFISVWTLTNIEKRYGAKSNLYKEAYARLQQAFDNLIDLARHENFSLTILFMPAQSSLVSSKRSEDSWGSASNLKSAKRQNQEPELIQSWSSSQSVASATSTSPAKVLAADGPLRGPIPTCFSQLSSCQTGTRNCSGHGECIAKFTTQGETCYGCVCSIPEVRTNPDGSKKTTRFGGAACHKKDIVTPFWLFAGFTVVMVSLVSCGVGMLYSMGSEELPSVIGAGVSGPRAK